MRPPRPTRPSVPGSIATAPRGLLDLLQAQIAQQADADPSELAVNHLAPIPPHKPKVTDWQLGSVVPSSGWHLRGSDAHGNGAFGARRSNWRNETYDHQGIDVAVDPGTPIFSPADGTIKAITGAYRDPKNDPTGGKLKQITVLTHDGHQIQIMYVVPRDDLAIDMAVRAGETIGQADDMTSGRTGMTNHVHIQIPANAAKTIFYDPTPWVLSWIKRRHDD